MVEWISHRGYCQSAAENTLASFRAAEAIGFRHIETDLRLTKDRQIVLCHDEDLERMAGLSQRIEGSTREELQKVRLSDGSSLCFLDELLDQFEHLRWTFDIKEPHGAELLSSFYELIYFKKKERWISSHVTFLAWSPVVESGMKAEFPQAQFYARLEECKRAGLAHLARLSFLSGVTPSKIYSLSQRIYGVSLFQKSLVDRYHKQGAQVLAFLPETREDARRALKAGFDQILSDHPPIS